MKTYSETLKWLRDRKILNEVFYNHSKYPMSGESGKTVCEIFNQHQRNFIASCFIFVYTEQGFNFWDKIHMEFYMWYQS